MHKVSRDNVLCGESGVANRSGGASKRQQSEVTNGTRIQHVSMAYSRDVANNVHGNVQAIQYLTRFKAPSYKSTRLHHNKCGEAQHAGLNTSRIEWLQQRQYQ